MRQAYNQGMQPDSGKLCFNLPGVAIVRWDAASRGAHIEVAYFATLGEARVWLVRSPDGSTTG